MKLKKSIAIISVLFLLLPCSFVNAVQIIDNNLIEFSLSLRHQTTHFKFPLNSYKVKSDQVGISWYEPFSQYFHGGLELGYIDMSQIENPLSSAQFSSGQYAGLLLRFLPVDKPYLSLTLNLNYRYNRTEAKSTTQNSQFAWHETLLFSELKFFPTEQFSVVIAAEYQLLNGEQRDSGTITKTTSFKEDQQQGYRLGMNFIPYHNGIIGVEWLYGFRQGGIIYFKRRF